jgi:Flp pilus assembly protein TadB
MGGMPQRSHRFSHPVYESLPWFYITCGVLALIASYLLASRGGLSLLTGLLGLVTLVGGIVVLLRRRDYRHLRSQYANPDSLNGQGPP